ncbi:MAG: hypothetical protein L3V56_00205 [Candidatus Magnetoovum sp. WYHC-5]|nr:hypothetical protein [Candidatus Magnetoovum sp. WYHC-5]
MNKFLLIISILIPPLGLVYLLAAINLRIGYSKLFCGAPKTTVRQRIIAKMEAKGIAVPAWLKKEPKSC